MITAGTMDRLRPWPVRRRVCPRVRLLEGLEQAVDVGGRDDGPVLVLTGLAGLILLGSVTVSTGKNRRFSMRVRPHRQVAVTEAGLPLA